MGIVKETLDALEAVAKAIENIEAIVEAVRDGKDYLAKKHPEAMAHVAAMLGEMRKTMGVVRDGSAVLTGFWFAADNASLRDFNALYRGHLRRAQELEAQIENLRGHCTVIRDHAFAMQVKEIKGGWPFLWVGEMLGLSSAAREHELGQRLDKLAYEDGAVANAAGQMLGALNSSLRSVQEALGSDRVADPANVAAAGALLAEHAAAFDPLEKEAEKAAAAIEKLVRAMTAGVAH
jgi:hypothetical protein